jgi:siroheme synthase (precorrin-2 oxidase/ferrochelatase)
LDEFEIEALFQIELDKIFNKTDPSFDPLEREEEMNRMREHVMNEIDRDKDRMVSLQEFMESTKQKNFDQNDEWKTVEDEQQFNQKEFEEFKKEHVS